MIVNTISTELNPPPLAEDPERFDRSGEKAPGLIVAIAKFVKH